MLENGASIDPAETLAALATRLAGADKVFQRRGLDFCCHGQVSLRDACSARALDPAAVIAELSAVHPTAPPERWDLRTVPELIDHLLVHYHRVHREELPHLMDMARKVERIHAESPDRPVGLAAHLAGVAVDLESHMQKEEQILFPMLRAGHGSHAAGPIQVMESEHFEHGQNLALLRQLAHDFVAPAAACATWRALYLGLEEFERQLMQHIHLENHVLFPRVLGS